MKQHYLPKKLLETTTFAFGLTLSQFMAIFVQVIFVMGFFSIANVNNMVVWLFISVCIIGIEFGFIKYCNYTQRGLLKHLHERYLYDRKVPPRYSGREQIL